MHTYTPPIKSLRLHVRCRDTFMCHKDNLGISRCFPFSLLPIWGRDGMSDKGERQTGMGGDIGKFSLKSLRETNWKIHWVVSIIE